jgi:3-oxoacyl-[acyl-carrier protein] reductase
MKNLQNRVALVTGGSRGIGAGIAIALAQAGADVAVNYRERTETAQAVCAEISALGRRALAVRADVSVAADVAEMIATINRELGPVSILVNNAGIAHRQLFEEISERDWDEILATNLKSVFLVTQAVVGDMQKQRWGRIINVSSLAAQTGGSVGAHYAASKAGMLGLTHACASRYVRDGITVNAIAPALIQTEMSDHLKANPERVPMGHLGSVDDIASVAVMLATNEYMTGQTVQVNGGMYMT